MSDGHSITWLARALRGVAHPWRGTGAYRLISAAATAVRAVPEQAQARTVATAAVL